MIGYCLILLGISFAISFGIQKFIVIRVPDQLFKYRNENGFFKKNPRVRLGGIGIFAGFLMGVSLKSLPLVRISAIQPESAFQIVNSDILIIAFSLIFILGLVDDFVGLSAWVKLPVEICVAFLLFLNHYSIRIITLPFGIDQIILPDLLSFIVTVLWIVGITNAMNLIDGIDGFAGGAALISMVSFLVLAFVNGRIEMCLISFPMIGAVLAFLFFNTYPSKIYLGDSGSLLLGFFLAVLSLKGSVKSSFGMVFIIPLTILFIPILDSLLALLRRLWNRKNPFRADRDHIHHKFLKKGFGERWTFMILMCMMLFCSVLGIALNFISRETRIVVFLILLPLAFCSMVYFCFIKYKKSVKPK
jgi:UDP-GlcNAc:undecaprenyl-phosphate GlcNAc-1-phosphate transferase